MSQVSTAGRSHRQLGAASRRPASNLQRLAVVGTLAFAAMLILSAWFKAENNSKAAASLLWTGLEKDVRVLAIDVLGFVEAAVGAALIVFPGRRLVHVVAILLAAGLTTGHVIGMVKGAGDCGCFGDLAVPDWVTLTGLGVGFVSSIVRWIGLRGATGVSKVVMLRLALVLAGSVAGMFPWVEENVIPILPAGIGTKGLPKVVTPAERLLDKLGIPLDAGADMLIVVGRWSCDKCKETLKDFADKRRANEQVADLMFYFVVSDQDKGKPPVWARGFDWMLVETIPDKLWWDLIIDQSPTLIRVKPGEELKLAKKWEL